MSLSLSSSLDMDFVVTSLLTEELRRKSSLDSTGDVIVVPGRSTKRDNGQRSKSRSKSKRKKQVRCWDMESQAI